MRMKELEALTGVNRETIRFYLREGLLPEPARKGKTSASYDDTHVLKLRAIRKLQEERHLPLSVIRALLNNGDGEIARAAAAFPELEADLRSRLMQRTTAAEQVEPLAARLGWDANEFGLMVQSGMLRPYRESDDSVWLKGTDVVLAERFAALKAVGFTEERGFGADVLRMYLEFTEWLVTEELRLFLNNMAGVAGSAEVATAAERGVDIMNEVLSLLRTRSILDKVHEISGSRTIDSL
jgi:DNA-binding transcriptional MerR regulator